MATSITARFRQVRKAGPFSNGDLEQGEVGIDTTTGDLYVSTDGTSVQRYIASEKAVGFVYHGSNPNLTRPDFGMIIWIGSVEPNNQQSPDIYYSIS